MSAERRGDVNFALVVAVAAFIGAPVASSVGVAIWIEAGLVGLGVSIAAALLWVARRDNADPDADP